MNKTHNTNPGSSVKKRRKGSSSTQTTHLSTTTSKHNNNNNNPNPDLISTLPDSLLLHILSLLDMDQVMKTSLLSRRWRYLWKSIPCLCFQPYERPSPFRGTQLTNFIDRCLFHHEGSKIHKLHINFDCEDDDDTHAPLVDSWLHFAIRRKVEDFKLHFVLNFDCYYHDTVDQYDKHYRLPRSFYWCTTLTSLNLRECNLNLPADSFQLSSLKTLTLELIDLLPDSIEHLSSNCPLLEEIYLIYCNGGRDLINIVITNEHVKKLEISNYGDDGSEIKINAPTLLSLGIYDCYPAVRLHVEELGSLTSADIIGDPCSFYCYENVVHCVEKLLYDFRHVKNLKLCGLRLQLLSVSKLMDILPISATTLELNASLKKWELPGISYLLECCSNLQKLKIVNDDHCGTVRFSDEFIDDHDFEEEEYWESFGTDVQPSIMQNIKTIEIDLGSESRHEEFVRFLLQNAKVLERMVIDTPKKYANNFALLFKLSQRLNAFPRSSPNAKLSLSCLL